MNRRPPAGRTVLLAGWLFADLLLLLFVIALGSLPREQRTSSASTPSPSASATAVPSKSAQPAERGLVLKPCSFTVRTGGAGSVKSQFGSQLKRAGVANRTAGFVLSFGTAPTALPGQAAAEKVNSQIKALPRFAHAPKRGYWKGGPLGKVRIDVFFLADPKGDTSFPKGCHSSDD